MRYVLGRRAKFYRVRRLHVGWQATILLVAVISFAGAAASIAPHAVQQTLGLGKSFFSSGPGSKPSPSGDTYQTKGSGSSKPPPKGTVTKNTRSTGTGRVKAKAVRQASCNTSQPSHPGLASSSSSQLRKLAQYEALCKGGIFSRSSFFVTTPGTVAQAEESAQGVAAQLKAYSRAGVPPVVFMEPDSLDLSQYAKGAYDPALKAYFQALQSAGITASMMGTWVHIPEGNLPIWSTTDPAIYAAVVTRVATLQKQYFPGSQSSLMLDSASYPVGGTWGQGKFVSLAPFVKNIPKGLFDSFGLQGFPWAAPANDPNNTFYNPSAYLRTAFAVEAARILGTKKIWVNTGTFGSKYTNTPKQAISLSPAQRQTMLNGVVQLMKQVKAQGFSATIHLFAENKSDVAEATDWSYWKTTPGDTGSTATLATFLHDASSAGIQLWLYDNE